MVEGFLVSCVHEGGGGGGAAFLGPIATGELSTVHTVDVCSGCIETELTQPQPEAGVPKFVPTAMQAMPTHSVVSAVPVQQSLSRAMDCQHPC
jgi:hypothetical protein